MERRRFRKLVERALGSLPEPFRRHLANVEIVIEDEPSAELLRSLDMDPERDTLLGFYDGVPLTDRGDHMGDLPAPIADTIMIFQRPIEEECADDAEVVEQVRITVLHEVGHHFGLDDDRIDELGYG